MEILFAPQGLAKSLKVFERPSWLAVDKKEGQEWLINQERKKKNIVAFQCSQTQQPPPQAFLSAMEETTEVWCVLLLFFLTSCAQYFCLSLLLKHSKQHHKANDKKTKSFHAVQLPPPLPGTLMGNFLLRLTKLNKNCMDSSVMTIFSTTHPRRHFCIYTDTLRGWQQL